MATAGKTAGARWSYWRRLWRQCKYQWRLCNCWSRQSVWEWQRLYFFRTVNAWSQTAKLTASDGAADDKFGYSVGISGNYAIVGAPYHDLAANQGGAYIFYRGSGWTTGQPHQAKLLAPDAAADDNFGYSVSINGDYCVVGAPSDDAPGYINQGAAYVFGRISTLWPHLAKLNPNSSTAGLWFGASVAISGDYIVVGAPYDASFVVNVQGKAFVFYGGGGWMSGMPVNNILSSNNPFPNGANDRFGYSVSITVNAVVIVGAPFYDAGTKLSPGSAFLFNVDHLAGGLIRRVDDNSGEYNGRFGWSVGLSGFNLVIGATNKNSTKGELSFLNVQ